MQKVADLEEKKSDNQWNNKIHQFHHQVKTATATLVTLIQKTDVDLKANVPHIVECLYSISWACTNLPTEVRFMKASTENQDVLGKLFNERNWHLMISLSKILVELENLDKDKLHRFIMTLFDKDHFEGPWIKRLHNYIDDICEILISTQFKPSMKLYQDAKQGSNSNLDELNNILFPDLDACLSFYLDKKYILLLSSSIENILADDNNSVTIQKIREFLRIFEIIGEVSQLLNNGLKEGLSEYFVLNDKNKSVLHKFRSMIQHCPTICEYLLLTEETYYQALFSWLKELHGGVTRCLRSFNKGSVEPYHQVIAQIREELAQNPYSSDSIANIMTTLNDQIDKVSRRIRISELKQLPTKIASSNERDRIHLLLYDKDKKLKIWYDDLIIKHGLTGSSIQLKSECPSFSQEECQFLVSMARRLAGYVLSDEQLTKVISENQLAAVDERQRIKLQLTQFLTTCFNDKTPNVQDVESLKKSLSLLGTIDTINESTVTRIADNADKLEKAIRIGSADINLDYIRAVVDEKCQTLHELKIEQALTRCVRARTELEGFLIYHRDRSMGKMPYASAGDFQAILGIDPNTNYKLRNIFSKQHKFAYFEKNKKCLEDVIKKLVGYEVNSKQISGLEQLLKELLANKKEKKQVSAVKDRIKSIEKDLKNILFSQEDEKTPANLMAILKDETKSTQEKVIACNAIVTLLMKISENGDMQSHYWQRVFDQDYVKAKLVTDDDLEFITRILSGIPVDKEATARLIQKNQQELINLLISEIREDDEGQFNYLMGVCIKIHTVPTGEEEKNPIDAYISSLKEVQHIYAKRKYFKRLSDYIKDEKIDIAYIDETELYNLRQNLLTLLVQETKDKLVNRKKLLALMRFLELDTDSLDSIVDSLFPQKSVKVISDLDSADNLLNAFSYYIDALRPIFETIQSTKGHITPRCKLNLEYLIERIGLLAQQLIDIPIFRETIKITLSFRYLDYISIARKALAHSPLALSDDIIHYLYDSLVLDTQLRIEEKQKDVQFVLAEVCQRLLYQRHRIVSPEDLEEKRDDILTLIAARGFNPDVGLFGKITDCNLGPQGDINVLVDPEQYLGRETAAKVSGEMIILSIELSRLLCADVRLLSCDAILSSGMVMPRHCEKIDKNATPLPTLLNRCRLKKLFSEDRIAEASIGRGQSYTKHEHIQYRYLFRLFQLLLGKSQFGVEEVEQCITNKAWFIESLHAFFESDIGHVSIKDKLGCVHIIQELLVSPLVISYNPVPLRERINPGSAPNIPIIIPEDSQGYIPSDYPPQLFHGNMEKLEDEPELETKLRNIVSMKELIAFNEQLVADKYPGYQTYPAYKRHYATNGWGQIIQTEEYGTLVDTQGCFVRLSQHEQSLLFIEEKNVDLFAYRRFDIVLMHFKRFLNREIQWQDLSAIYEYFHFVFSQQRTFILKTLSFSYTDQALALATSIEYAPTVQELSKRNLGARDLRRNRRLGNPELTTLIHKHAKKYLRDLKRLFVSQKTIFRDLRELMMIDKSITERAIDYYAEHEADLTRELNSMSQQQRQHRTLIGHVIGNLTPDNIENFIVLVLCGRYQEELGTRELISKRYGELSKLQEKYQRYYPVFNNRFILEEINKNQYLTHPLVLGFIPVDGEEFALTNGRYRLYCDYITLRQWFLPIRTSNGLKKAFHYLKTGGALNECSSEFLTFYDNALNYNASIRISDNQLEFMQDFNTEIEAQYFQKTQDRLIKLKKDEYSTPLIPQIMCLDTNLLNNLVPLCNKEIRYDLPFIVGGILGFSSELDRRLSETHRIAASLNHSANIQQLFPTITLNNYVDFVKKHPLKIWHYSGEIHGSFSFEVKVSTLYELLQFHLWTQEEVVTYQIQDRFNEDSVCVKDYYQFRDQYDKIYRLAQFITGLKSRISELKEDIRKHKHEKRLMEVDVLEQRLVLYKRAFTNAVKIFGQLINNLFQLPYVQKRILLVFSMPISIDQVNKIQKSARFSDQDILTHMLACVRIEILSELYKAWKYPYQEISVFLQEIGIDDHLSVDNRVIQVDPPAPQRSAPLSTSRFNLDEEYDEDMIDKLLNPVMIHKVSGLKKMDSVTIMPVSYCGKLRHSAFSRVQPLQERLKTVDDMPVSDQPKIVVFPTCMSRHYFLVVFVIQGMIITPFYIHSINSALYDEIDGVKVYSEEPQYADDDIINEVISSIQSRKFANRDIKDLIKYRFNQQTALTQKCGGITVQNAIDIATGRITLHSDGAIKGALSISTPNDADEYIGKQQAVLSEQEEGFQLEMMPAAHAPSRNFSYTTNIRKSVNVGQERDVMSKDSSLSAAMGLFSPATRRTTSPSIVQSQNSQRSSSISVSDPVSPKNSAAEHVIEGDKSTHTAASRTASSVDTRRAIHHNTESKSHISMATVEEHWATTIFSGKTTEEDQRVFSTWYSSELLPILMQANLPKSHTRPILYFAPQTGYGGIRISYEKHIKYFIEYLNLVKNCGIMLSVEPGAGQNHYVVTIVSQEGELFYIDPTTSRHADASTYFAQLIKDHIIKSGAVYKSHQPIQHDPGKSIVSCGPIGVELVRFFATVENLIGVLRTASQRTGGASFDLLDILNNSHLKELALADEEAYAAIITQIRESHFELLSTLGLKDVQLFAEQEDIKLGLLDPIVHSTKPIIEADEEMDGSNKGSVVKELDNDDDQSVDDLSSSGEGHNRLAVPSQLC